MKNIDKIVTLIMGALKETTSTFVCFIHFVDLCMTTSTLGYCFWNMLKSYDTGFCCEKALSWQNVIIR